MGGADDAMTSPSGLALGGFTDDVIDVGMKVLKGFDDDTGGFDDVIGGCDDVTGWDDVIGCDAGDDSSDCEHPKGEFSDFRLFLKLRHRLEKAMMTSSQRLTAIE